MSEPGIARAAARPSINDNIRKRRAAEPAAISSGLIDLTVVHTIENAFQIEIRPRIEPRSLARALQANKRSLHIFMPPASNN